MCDLEPFSEIRSHICLSAVYICTYETFAFKKNYWLDNYIFNLFSISSIIYWKIAEDLLQCDCYYHLSQESIMEKITLLLLVSITGNICLCLFMCFVCMCMCMYTCVSVCAYVHVYADV